MGLTLKPKAGNASYFQGALTYDAAATDPLSGTVNDLNVANSSDVSAILINATAAVTLNGLVGGTSNRQLELINQSLFTVTIAANAAGSTAANRFAGAGAIFSGETVQLVYNSTLNLWCVAAGANAGTGGGGTSAAFALNTSNGSTLSIAPVVTTGLNSDASSATFDFGTVTFTGNLFNDPVVSVGYNVNAGGIASLTPDPFSHGQFFENDYNNQFSSGNATGGNATTLTDSGRTDAVNGWIDWVLFNSTTGGRGLITSNTATVITCSGGMLAADGITTAPANATGNAYQILRRDFEDYHQIAQNSGVYRSFRPFFWTWDKSTMLATPNGITITGATSANPCVFTYTEGGLRSTEWIKFAGLPGTFGTNFNGKQLAITVLSPTTFSVNVNTTSYTAYTSGGTGVVEPLCNSSLFMMDQNNGFQFRVPSWNPGPNDNVMKVSPGLLNLYDNNTGSAKIQFNTSAQGGASSTEIQMQNIGLNSARISSSFRGTINFYGSDINGANEQITGFSSRINGGVRSLWCFGADNFQTGVVSITNLNMLASTPLLALKDAGSQSGDRIQSYQSDGTTLNWAIQGTTLTGAQTATFVATNKPGSGTAAPIAWLPVKTTGGTQGYIPIFGA